jgi:hypothetical protein
MPNQAKYPLINGVRHDWSSVEIRVATNVILGITKIDYSDKLTGTAVRGAGPKIIAYTTGMQENTGGFTILLEEFNALQEALQTINPDAWKLAYFDIEVSYQARGLSTVSDAIRGCRVDEVKVGTTDSGSADPTTRDLTLLVTDILWNGVSGNPVQPTVA